MPPFFIAIDHFESESNEGYCGGVPFLSKISPAK